MRHTISPFRYALGLLLNLFGRRSGRSRFSPARSPESRQRFAQYLCRVQPTPEEATAQRAARLLGHNGAVTRGHVRHAAFGEGTPSRRTTAALHLFGQPNGLAARRRAQAGSPSVSLRTLLDALRVR